MEINWTYSQMEYKNKELHYQKENRKRIEETL